MTTTGTLGAFFSACDLAAGVIGEKAVADRWEEPSALEGFSVGGVAAHVYGAIRRFEKALDEPVLDAVTVVGLADFYGKNRVERAEDLQAGMHPLVREDAEKRASYGAESVAQRFDELTGRLRERLPAEAPERLVTVWTVPNGATRLETYLATRVIELVVHADDLAASVDLPPLAVPREAATVVIGAFVELARARSGDVAVIRAFSRVERAEPDALRVL